MISIGAFYPSVDPSKVVPFDYAALKESMALMKAIEKPPDVTLFLREKPAVAETTSQPLDRLFGVPVVMAALPKTVKDKDGNEVELLGILMSEGDSPVEKRMAMLTGEIVKKKVQVCESA